MDPKVGLYASFCIAAVIAFVGGRPGMTSAATGAMALLMVLLVKEHGLECLLAATILTGVLEMTAGYFKLEEENSLDIIAMEAYSHNRLRSVIFGSFTSEMLQKSKNLFYFLDNTLFFTYLIPYR